MGYCEQQIWDWAKTQPIFSDYYKFNKRCGCMGCPMMSLQNQAYLKMYYPKEYQEIMEMAKASEEMRSQELGRPFSVWASNPKYDTVYRDNIVDSKYIPQLKRQLNEPIIIQTSIFD